MKYRLLADAECCRDKASLVPILREIGYLSSSTAAPADQSVLRVSLYEATGSFCSFFCIPTNIDSVSRMLCR